MNAERPANYANCRELLDANFGEAFKGKGCSDRLLDVSPFPLVRREAIDVLFDRKRPGASYPTPFR